MENRNQVKLQKIWKRPRKKRHSLETGKRGKWKKELNPQQGKRREIALRKVALLSKI